MRISKQSYVATGAGFTPWVPVDYLQGTFNLGLAVIPSAAAATISFSVQYTMDDLSIARTVNWTQTTTTVTITDGTQGPSNAQPGNPHGLITTDSIYIYNTQATGTGFTNFDGTYQVTVTSPTVYTITVVPSQTAAGYGFVNLARVFTTTGIPAASATRIAANFTQPCTAVRLAVATLSAGSLDFIVIQGL